MLGLNFGVTCAVTLVSWSFEPDLSAPGPLATFALCLAFTNGFGIPAAFAMTRLGGLVLEPSEGGGARLRLRFPARAGGVERA